MWARYAGLLLVLCSFSRAAGESDLCLRLWFMNSWGRIAPWEWHTGNGLRFLKEVTALLAVGPSHFRSGASKLQLEYIQTAHHWFLLSLEADLHDSRHLWQLSRRARLVSEWYIGVRRSGNIIHLIFILQLRIKGLVSSHWNISTHLRLSVSALILLLPDSFQ